jgi:hypothetical protein
MRPARLRQRKAGSTNFDTQLLLQLCAIASMIFVSLIVVGSIGPGPKYGIESLPPGGANVAANVRTPSR